jgi:hypothetical protein
MAFYPTWQTTAAAATTEQAWQNQFIQQIPQNGTASSVPATIAPLNSLDFQQVRLFQSIPKEFFVIFLFLCHLPTGLCIPSKWICSDNGLAV